MRAKKGSWVNGRYCSATLIITLSTKYKASQTESWLITWGASHCRVWPQKSKTRHKILGNATHAALNNTKKLRFHSPLCSSLTIFPLKRLLFWSLKEMRGTNVNDGRADNNNTLDTINAAAFAIASAQNRVSQPSTQV